MPGSPSPPAAASIRTAISVMRTEGGPMLCPFFGKCDGVLVIEHPAGRVEFHGNPRRTSEALCDLVLASGASRLICGFVGERERQRLRAAGVDVRLGSCACPVDMLTAAFLDLPEA